MPGDTANKGTLRTELHTMSMATTRYSVSNFGAAVNVKVEQAGHFAAKCTKPKKYHNHEQKYNTPSATVSHFMIRAIDPIVDDQYDSEVECSADETNWGPFDEDESARPVEVDLNAPRRTCEVIANEKRKYHEITSMKEKTEGKLQSSLYMISQLEDRVDSIHGDVENVHDHMLEIEIQQEERRNHLIIQHEETYDLTARVKVLEEHLVKSREYNLQQAGHILQMQKRINALEENRKQSVERKWCDYKGCNAPVYIRRQGPRLRHPQLRLRRRGRYHR
jgi:hypothetical protein